MKDHGRDLHTNRSATIVGLLVSLCVLALGARADAAITSIRPGAPTSQDVILATITFPNPGCVPLVTTAITGSVIRTDISLRGCAYILPGLNSTVAPFGPLRQGTYTYEVYVGIQDPPMLLDRRTLVIAEAPVPVPALGVTASVLLLALIVTVAMLQLK